MKFIIILLTLTCQLCSAQKKPWPTVLKEKGLVTVIMPKSDIPPFIYTTRNYRFISQKKFCKTQISKLATTAESGVSAPPQSDNGASSTKSYS